LENFDLHNHSTCSDGLLTPTQLIDLATRNGTDAIALTDHDNIDGLEEADRAARQAGIGFVPGVEISVSWGDTTLHVVGLNIDPASADLRAALEEMRSGRLARGRQIEAALAKLGFEGTFEAALALAGNETLLSRTHFARHLVERGAAKDIQNAFDRYLGTGKPAYVSHRWASLEEAVGLISGSGGVAVLAHPGRYDLKPMFRDELLTQFKTLGGAAIEVVTGSHRPEQYATWGRVAQHYGFLASRGADFHGLGESPCEPGRLPSLAATLTPVWSLWTH
jgi:predicted metal-dependent phosphoesterase TrpH